MNPGDMPVLAAFLARALDPTAGHGAGLAGVAAEVSAWRAPYTRVRFTAARTPLD